MNLICFQLDGLENRSVMITEIPQKYRNPLEITKIPWKGTEIPPNIGNKDETMLLLYYFYDLFVQEVQNIVVIWIIYMQGK